MKKLINRILLKIKSLVLNVNKISKDALIGSNTIVSDCIIYGKITVGEKCKLHKLTIRGQVIVGDNTSITGPNTYLYSKNNFITIGKFCSIARNVSIQENDHNFNKVTTYYIGKNFFKEKWDNEDLSKGNISIGNDVWIGAGATILSGSKIGDGAVIGANALVSGVVPPYAIMIGSPAKVIKYRFNEVIVAKLMDMKWWDWDETKIKLNKDFFTEILTEESLNRYI